MKNIENPLLKSFPTPYQTPPFGEISTEDYEPAFQKALKEALQEIERIANSSEEPDFQNTVAALDYAGETLNTVSAIFFNLNSACTDPLMQKTAQKISPLLTDFSNNVYMNARLFNRVKAVYEHTPHASLTAEQLTLLEDTWKAFIRGGAGLSEDAQERFRSITTELSRLSLQFEENVLAETNAYQLHITRPEDLAGLPESTKEAAALTAKEKNKEGWIFTLHAPSYIPFLKYADNRSLREKIFKAYTSRCNRNNSHNNTEIIRQITALRLEKARILGFHTYAEYVLSNRMAQSPAEVNDFLQLLFAASHPAALKEKKAVEDFALQLGLADGLQRWDWTYYTNKLKQEKYALDDEMLKPYFRLENVQEGIFLLANQLYGLTFREVKTIPLYHPDVKTFEVRDYDDRFLAILYTDFFPRDNKNAGAWMTEFRTQHHRQNEDVRPLVSLVMNFTKPTTDKPSLLTFDEVTTFLHEFGHALHGILSQNTYHSTAGTNVYRDFVELPSQLMENWATEKAWLDQWAVHYKTGEKIPQEYIDKIKKAANFQSGYQSDRQLSFGMVDMAWHSITHPIEEPVCQFEKLAMQPAEIFPEVPGSCFSTAFGHIFDGGYAAGYYSYKWAEVLDADAFSLFREKGIFDQETARSFRKNILEKGGSEHPMKLYERFRGRKPSVDALLERSGLKDISQAPGGH